MNKLDIYWHTQYGHLENKTQCKSQIYYDTFSIISFVKILKEESILYYEIFFLILEWQISNQLNQGHPVKEKALAVGKESKEAGNVSVIFYTLHLNSLEENMKNK